MRKGGDLRQLRGLMVVHEALTGAAADAVAAAAERERTSRNRADDAGRRAAQAGEQWYAQLSACFDPDRNMIHAQAVIRDEAAANAAERDAARAAEERAERERDWRAARASERAVGTLAGALRRDDAKRREEARLAATSDRVAFLRVRA